MEKGRGVGEGEWETGREGGRGGEGGLGEGEKGVGDGEGEVGGGGGRWWFEREVGEKDGERRGRKNNDEDTIKKGHKIS